MQEYSAGTPLSVSGFGTNRLMGPVSPVLKKMDMVVVSQGTCQQQWPGMRIGTGQMCAALAPGYGVCQVSFMLYDFYMVYNIVLKTLYTKNS